MARKSQSPRRGRAELATASDASQQPADEGHEADAEETNKPRGRGRPRKSLDSNPDVTDTPDVQPQKKPRGRPSMGIMAAKAAAAADAPKKKRGRPSLGEKKTKSPRAATTSEQGDVPSSASKRGRPRKEADEGADEDDYVDHPRPAKKKRGRPSLKDQLPTEEDEANATSGGKKRGRKPLRDRASWGEKRQPPNQRPEAGEDEEQEEEEEEGEEAEDEEQDDDAASEEEEGEEEEEEEDEAVDEEPQDHRRQSAAPPKPYPHVVPRVRGVKQATIDAKWNPLTASSIAAATETLTLAHRPIMQRLANTQQRRQHTASALSLLHRRVSRKLKRGLPFPPPAVAATAATSRKQAKGGRRAGGGGHEAELDFESVLHGAEALERQLDPALHSLELLKKEKERMEQELEKDYQTLQHLEAGARMQAREQRDQLKKTHALVPDALAQRKDQEQEVEMKFEHNGAVAPGIVFKDIEDGELKDLALQLGGHVDSMRTNLKQADGLVPQMAKSRAALRSVLLRHLGQEQYDEVVLGH